MGGYEAVWRIMRHEIHHQEPAVVDLSIHLPDEQLITFNDEALPEGVMETANNSKSKLMAYFETNAIDESVHEHLYINFPKHYTWVKLLKNGRQVKEALPLADSTLLLLMQENTFICVC